MIVIRNNIIPFKGYKAMMLFGLLFVRKGVDLTISLLNHERTHVRQMCSLGIILYYPWYLVEYFLKLLYYRNHKKAYRAICFERDACNNEVGEKSGHYSWLKQIWT